MGAQKVAMKYKIHYKKGFTLIELVLVVVIILTFTSTIILNVRGPENKKRARDNVRLSDIANIERAINEYLLDNSSYPGELGIVYVSDTVNWIAGLSEYITALPMDPVNEGNYRYFYTHNGTSYEIDGTMEFFSELSKKDNGDNSEVYEVGNDLSLITDL